MTNKDRFASKAVHKNDVNIEGVRSGGNFDPFSSRTVKNPTTNFDTLVHLLKAVFGTGILSMPFAFRQSGLLLGGIATLIIGFISTHCAYILVKCAHILYYKTEKTKMSFPDVAEHALATGPKSLRKYSKCGRYVVEGMLFIAYLGTCSVFVVVAATNYVNVYHELFADSQLQLTRSDFQQGIICLIIPLVLLSWIPDLKYLVPISMMANFFMIISVAIIFYWILGNFSNGGFKPETFSYFPSSFSEFVEKFPKFFSITIFAMESIGVIMPIENKMKTPQKFTGTFGVLNLGMAGITVMYIVIGAMGYMNDPRFDRDMIVQELPPGTKMSQIAQILVGTAVLFTCRLLFSVCLEISEEWLNNFGCMKSKLFKYIFRTFLMITCILLAYVVPGISEFMALVGSICFSIQGFIIPVILETIVFWDIGFGFCKWMAVKNVLIVVVAAFAMFYGGLDAVNQIIALYHKK